MNKTTKKFLIVFATFFILTGTTLAYGLSGQDVEINSVNSINTSSSTSTTNTTNTTNQTNPCKDGHSFTNYVSNNDATCTADGTKTATCDRCDATDTIADTGSAKGHTPATDSAVAPTCTTTGLTEGSHCSVCGTVLTKQETVAKIEHTKGTPVEENRVEPTCTSNGSYDSVVYCSVCKTELSRTSETIEKLAHEYTTVVTEPTCTEQGYTTYKCKNCDYSYVGDYVAAKGHTPATDSAVAPTCTETGLTEGSHCSVCNAVITAQETIPALGHDWQLTTAQVNATCTENGATAIYTCSRCNTTKGGDTIIATGHKAVTDAAKAATCTETGLTEGSHCLICNTVIKAQETIPALGHTEVTDVAKDATYTETGLTEGSHCSVCGAIIKAQETIPKLTATITKAEFVSASNTTYFIGEKFKSTITIEYTYSDGTVQQQEYSPSTISGFSTEKYNNNMKCTFTDQHGNSFDIAFKCFPSQATLIANGDTSKSISVAFGKKENISSNIAIPKSGMSCTYQILLRNKKIALSKEAKKVLKLNDSPKKDSDFSGTLSVKPKKAFKSNKKIYVLITGEANGKTYKYKIFVTYQPDAPKKISSKRSSKTISLTWKKVSDVKTYEVQYSNNKDFKNADKTSQTVKTNKINLKTSSSKKYYVRIRSISKENIPSDWSIKTVK